jgi:outer membrane protein, heavy metal efflux system
MIGGLYMPSRGTRMHVLLCILFVLCVSRIQAQESDVPSRLTLDDALGLATGRNPALAVAINEIQAAEGDKIAANKRPNPAFSVQLEDFPLRAHPGPFFNAQDIASRVDYEIERGGRRRLRTETTSQVLETRKLEYQDQIRLMKLEVQRVFYQVILAKSNLESSQLILNQAEQMISLNRVRFQQGDISALDMNRIEVEKLRFQDDVFQSDLALRKAKSALLALLNAPDLSRDMEVIGVLSVNPLLPEPGLPQQASLTDLIQTALKQRPDLAARLQEIKRADAETQLQRAIRSPNVTVGGGYKRSGENNSFVLGVTIPLQIFNRNEGEIIRADAEKRRAINLAAAARKDVQLEVQQAHTAVEINRQRVDYMRTQQLRKAEEVSKVTLDSYNLGGSTLIDYLDAQRTYRDTLRIFNQALFDERISLYELSSSIALGVQ